MERLFSAVIIASLICFFSLTVSAGTIPTQFTATQTNIAQICILGICPPAIS